MTATAQPRTASLGELAPGASIQVGPFGSQLHARDYSPTGVAVIMPSDLSNGRIDHRNAAHVPPHIAAALELHALQPGDLVFARRGDIGRVAVVLDGDTPAICGTGCIRVRLPPDALPLLILEACRTRSAQQWLLTHAVGQTMLNISAPTLSHLPILLPPQERHRDIAHFIATADDVLTKYSALIDAHDRRRRAILQLVFSRSHNLVYDESLTEAGGVAAGQWIERRLGDFGRISSGGTPSTSNPRFWNGTIPWCTPSDITRLRSRFIDGTDVCITEEGLASSSAELLPAGTVLVCTRATVGACAISRSPIATNQGFKSITPHHPEDAEFLYYLIQYLRPHLIRRSTGSTFLELTGPRFTNTHCLVPQDPAERIAIGRLLGALDDALFLLQQQRELLASLRRGALERLFACAPTKKVLHERGLTQ